jgi:uncharacterized membrane protein
MTMTDPTPQQPQPIVPNPQLALIVYVLYLIGYLTGGLTWIVGIIMAHVQVGHADPMLASHYRFQIRTFWIGLLYMVVGFVLMFVLIGFAVWVWLFVWSLVRNIKGLLQLNEGRPINNPGSWLFG